MTTLSTSSTEGNTVDDSQTKRQQEIEGTLHQKELGPKAQRKHFFSPLDPAWAEAVHRDAELVQYTPEEEVRQFNEEVSGSTNLQTSRGRSAARSIIGCSRL